MGPHNRRAAITFRPCPTSSTTALWRDWMAVCSACTWPMMLWWTGWHTSSSDAHDTTTTSSTAVWLCVYVQLVLCGDIIQYTAGCLSVGSSWCGKCGHTESCYSVTVCSTALWLCVCVQFVMGRDNMQHRTSCASECITWCGKCGQCGSNCSVTVCI